MKYLIVIIIMFCACSESPQNVATEECGECVDGIDGDPGIQGDIGPQGPQGIPGVDGANGTDGLPGATGATGPQGIQGEPGIDGDATGPSLLDKDGNQIDFEFEMTTFGNYEMFKTPSNCILVKSDDTGRPIDMAFDLITGDTMPCMQNRFDSWNASNAVYSDLNCSGDGYTIDYGPQSIVAIMGGTYYPTKPSIFVTNYYAIENGVCVQRQNLGGVNLYKYEPVPVDILNLMPDPPYTVE